MRLKLQSPNSTPRPAPQKREREGEYNYLEHEFHAFGDEAEPAAVFLSSGGGCVGGAGGGTTGGGRVGERVEQAFDSAGNRAEIDGGVEGVDRRNLVEAEFDPGRDQPARVELVTSMARERRERSADELWR